MGYAAEAAGSDVVKQTIDPADLLRVNRRKFLTLSGAIGTLAGVEGCIRRPAEKILPYTSQPEYVSPGVPLHYATVAERRGEAQGLLGAVLLTCTRRPAFSTCTIPTGFRAPPSGALPRAG